MSLDKQLTRLQLSQSYRKTCLRHRISPNLHADSVVMRGRREVRVPVAYINVLVNLTGERQREEAEQLLAIPKGVPQVLLDEVAMVAQAAPVTKRRKKTAGKGTPGGGM